jgi:hypothetical protein
MALSTIGRNQLNTGIDDNSDATAMTINSSENIGIGVSSPSVRLDTRLGTTTGKVAEFHNSAGYGIGFTVESDGGVNTINSETNQALAFATNGASNKRMTITSGGLVGIGATTVDRQLHIEGSRSNAYSSTDFDNTYNLIKIENPNTANNMATGIQFLVGSNGSAAISATRTGDGAASLCFGTRGGGSRAERMRITDGGVVLIGVTSFTSGGGGIKLGGVGNRDFSANSTNAIQQIGFHNPNGEVGSIFTSGTSTAFATSSDYRLKEAVVDMTGAIDRVKTLAPKRFNFIADPDTTVDGFLAHEAQAVVPEAVTGTHNEVDDDGNAVMQLIDQSKLVPLLTAALKESIAKIEALEAKVTALEAG